MELFNDQTPEQKQDTPVWLQKLQAVQKNKAQAVAERQAQKDEWVTAEEFDNIVNHAKVPVTCAQDDRTM